MRRVLALLVGLSCVLGGCSERYPQGTPTEVIESAKAMAGRGDVDRLPDLIHANSKAMRGTLDQLGSTLDAARTLALELESSFPAEVKRLRAEAEEAAADGRATNPLTAAMLGSRAQRSGGDDRQALKMFNDTLQSILADPFGWLQERGELLTAERYAEDVAAVQYAGKPVFGQLVGLSMQRQADGKWYVMLPVDRPPLNRMFEESEKLWPMIEKLLLAFENSIRDVTVDVRSGELRSLEEVANRVGEQLFIPIAFIAIAVDRLMDEDASEGDPGS